MTRADRGSSLIKDPDPRPALGLHHSTSLSGHNKQENILRYLGFLLFLIWIFRFISWKRWKQTRKRIEDHPSLIGVPASQENKMKNM